MAERYTQVPRATLWLVQGGDFVMGNAGDSDASPELAVEVGSFYLSKAPITNEQYQAFAPAYVRSPCSPGDDDPAVGVSFHDAVNYCNWYSQLSKKPFRLPTEPEWEFACRAGTRERYFFGNDPAGGDPYVWHQGNSDGRCHPSESSRPNPWGLYEMLGNVWEWTGSRYRPYPLRLDDEGPEAPGPRVLRGGSFCTPLDALGSGVRRAADPELCADDVGFRIVRSL